MPSAVRSTKKIKNESTNLRSNYCFVLFQKSIIMKINY